MPVPDRTGIPKDTQLYEQYVLNRTFDPEFEVMAVELLAYDRAAGVMRRVELVESTTTPGHYVLAVGNVDGSPITGGSGGGGGGVSSVYDTGVYGSALYA